MTPVTSLMLDALAEFGPMTAAELCSAVGRTHKQGAKAVSLLTKPSKQLPKRAYVYSYTFDGIGERRYPRAVYALGDKRDNPKPKPDPTATRRRWSESKQARVNSVWSLGLTKEQRIKANMGARCFA